MLCTNVGMVPDLVRDGENGIVLSGDIREDAAIFDRLCANKDGVTDALFQSTHDSDTVITWEDVIALHIQMYADIVQETRASLQA